MSDVKQSLGRELSAAARSAFVSILLSIMLLLPTAWMITRGLLPQTASTYVIRGLMVFSSFLIVRLVFQPKGKRLRAIALYTLMLYAVLLLLTAGMDHTVVSPLRPIPAVICGLIGSSAAAVAKNVKSIHKEIESC